MQQAFGMFDTNCTARLEREQGWNHIKNVRDIRCFSKGLGLAHGTAHESKHLMHNVQTSDEAETLVTFGSRKVVAYSGILFTWDS